MATTDVKALLKEMQSRGYDVEKTPNGKLRWSRVPANRDAEFEKRFKAASPVITPRIAGPTLAQRAKGVAAAGTFDRINGWLNNVRDHYAAPALGTVIQGLSGEAPSGGLDPSAEAVAEGALKFIAPDSMTGKAVSALTMMAKPIGAAEEAVGPSIRAGQKALGLGKTVVGKALTAPSTLRSAIPAIVGATTGAVSGEGAGSGALQGGLVGEAQEAGRVGKGVTKLARNLTRAAKVTEYDNTVPGEKLEPILNLTSYSKLLAGKGMNWVQALRSGRVGAEAGERLENHIDNIQNSIDYSVQQNVQKLTQDFQDRWNINPNGSMPPNLKAGQGGNTMGDQFQDELRDYVKAKHDAESEGVDIRKQISEMRKLKRGALNSEGRLKQGEAAASKYEDYKDALGNVRTTLASFDPQLRDAFDSANDEYSMFASLRDIADKPEVLMEGKKNVNLEAFQKALIDEPRASEPRMKDSFQAISDIVRRDAPPIAGTDQAGSLKRMRVIGRPTGLHVIADIFKRPYRNQYVGEVPGLLPKQPPVGAPEGLGSFLAGESANKLGDEMRDQNKQVETENAKVP